MKHTNYTGWINQHITSAQFVEAVERFIETELRLDWKWQLTKTSMAMKLTVPSRKLIKTVAITPDGLYTLMLVVLDHTNKADLTTIGDNYYEGCYHISSYRRNNVALHLDKDRGDVESYAIRLMNRRAAAVLRFGHDWANHSMLTIVDSLVNSFMATLDLQDTTND